jgi:hypothetical protein
MDRMGQLKMYSIAELVGELKRRKDELDSALAMFAGPGSTTIRNSRMSEAKARYWAEWHEYKATHPDATVEQWRRSQKRSAKK